MAGYGTLFSNRALGLGDNARLLANLVAHSVGREGVVLFDDGHQGLAPRYDPQQLFGDRRLHLSIGLVLALWLLWVLGRRGCAPAVVEVAPRPAELLRAAGGFLARVLPTAAAARRLLERCFARLPLPAEAQPAATARRPGEWLAGTRDWIRPAWRGCANGIDAAARGRPVPLAEAAQFVARPGETTGMTAEIGGLEAALRRELDKVVVGAETTIRALTIALVARGRCCCRARRASARRCSRRRSPRRSAATSSASRAPPT